MSAQEALPWNPNANNDNIIGTVDLLAMLNVYGEEYSVETCFKGEIYRAYDCQTYYIPNDCGTILAYRRQYCDGQACILSLDGYAEGDVIHVGLDNETAYGNDVDFQYFDSSDNLITLFSYQGPDYNNRGSVKFVFSGGVWTWNGAFSSWTNAPTSE